MRLRIVTHVPLPPLKVWFGLRQESDDGEGPSVAHLKSLLCHQLQLGPGRSGEHLMLELDGFELLDGSPCNLVLTDRDVIDVKLANAGLAGPRSPAFKELKLRKRKMSSSLVAQPSSPDRHVKRAKQELAISSVSLASTQTEESSDGDGSSSGSGSESSSASASDSTTSSSSSETSSSESAPSVRSSKIVPQPSSKKSTVNRSSKKVAVPPGQGKPSTQDRNRRRRIAKNAKQLSIGPLPAMPSMSPPKTQDASVVSHLVDLDNVSRPSPMMMMSLKNSNKRKGYKDRLKGAATPKRIVFDDSNEQAAPTPSGSKRRSSFVAVRLIPPSERTELPRNLIITSIDVESDLWPAAHREKPTRNDATHEYIDPSVSTDADGDVTLDYGEDPSVANQTANKFDWETVEARWEGYPLLQDPNSLKKGDIVGWKALGIDPSTLSPMLLLNLGRVLEVADTTIKIIILTRPGGDRLGFGLRMAEDAQMEDTGETETRPLTDITDWRMIDGAA